MEPTVLSRLDFDVLWENERFPRRHVALDVPSPGMTHTERSRIVQETWRSLEHRGLAERGRATPNMSDDLALLAYPRRAVYGFIWAPDRKITLLAASNGGSALMGVVDGDEVLADQVGRRGDRRRGGVGGRRHAAGPGPVDQPADAAADGGGRPREG